MIIADTATLIFWTLDRERLSAPAARAIAQADKIGVSSISIWEIGIKVGKGKLDLPLSIREFTDRLAQVDRVEILPVDAATWITNLELDWNHRDPADRTMVATAILQACPLVSPRMPQSALFIHRTSGKPLVGEGCGDGYWCRVYPKRRKSPPHPSLTGSTAGGVRNGWRVCGRWDREVRMPAFDLFFPTSSRCRRSQVVNHVPGLCLRPPGGQGLA